MSEINVIAVVTPKPGQKAVVCSSEPTTIRRILTYAIRLSKASPVLLPMLRRTSRAASSTASTKPKRANLSSSSGKSPHFHVLCLFDAYGNHSFKDKAAAEAHRKADYVQKAIEASKAAGDLAQEPYFKVFSGNSVAGFGPR